MKRSFREEDASLTDMQTVLNSRFGLRVLISDMKEAFVCTVLFQDTLERLAGASHHVIMHS